MTTNMRTVIAALILSGVLHAEAYQIRPSEAGRFALTVEKTGLYRGKKHLFLFQKFEGRLDFDAQKPEASKIELTIDANSLVCKDDWVSANDLKKVMETALDDMLSVKKFPSMTFVSAAIQAQGADKYQAQGTLTLRGIAKPASVTVTLDGSNPAALRLQGSAVIRLTDYKLKPPSALLGAIGTKNEMTLNFTLIATK
jgi:polyisoprenoid-binding protein YceI